MIDNLLFIGSILLGIICPLITNQFFIFKKNKKYKEYNDFKSELDKLTVEKSIALQAIDKTKQSFNAQIIDAHEKDKLLLKYNRLLDNYNEQISKIKPIVDINEIYEYRNQIHSFISDTICKIDKKLNELSDEYKYLYQNNKDKNIHNDRDKDKSIIDDHDKREGKEKVEFNKLSLKKPEKTYMENDNKEFFQLSSTYYPYPKNHVIQQKPESTPVTIKEKVREEKITEIDSEEIDKIQKEVLDILQRLEDS
jgi:hypothetical protein